MKYETETALRKLLRSAIHSTQLGNVPKSCQAEIHRLESDIVYIVKSLGLEEKQA